MASNSIGRIGLDLCLNKNAFNKEINNVGAYAQNTLSKSFRGVGKVLGGVVAGIGIAKFTKDCISLGSNLAEVQNVVDVTFGDMSACIDDFAQNQALGFGLSETSAKQYTGVLGAMLKSMGVGTAQAKDMSIEMTKLAGDMASFYNLDTDLAFEKIRAGISGETEPLKQLGINMSVANLEAYAMSQGITQSYQKMDQANQSLLRYNYLMSVTADAQGDFARTGGGWANQVRVLKLQWDSFRASMGQVFIAVLLPVVQMLNKVFTKINVVTKAFAQMVSALTGSKIDVGMGSVASTIQDATGNASNLTNGIGDVGKAAKKTAKDVASATSGLDELNILSPKSDSSSEDSGTGADLASGVGTDASSAVGETVDETMSLSNKLFDFFKPLQNSWNKYGMGIMLNFKSAWRDIKAVALSAGSIIASNWDSWFQALSDGIMSVGNIFSLIFKGFAVLLRSVWNNGGAYLFDQLLKLWTNLMRLGTAINDNLIAPFLNGINAFIMPAIGKLIGSGLNVIGDVISWLNKKIVSFVDNFNMTGATNSVASFKDKFMDSFLSVGAVIASIIIGFKAFNTISSSISILGNAFKSISKGISPIIKSVQVFFTLATNGLGITSALQASLYSIGQVLLGLFNPITLIVAMVAALITGFVYLYATSATFREQINGIFVSIGENIRGIVDGIVQIITTIYTLGIKPFIDSTMAAFDSLWNNGLSAFVENVSIFVFRLIDMVMSIWNNAINPFINLLLTIFLPIFTTVWDAILAVAVPIIEKIMEYVNKFMEVLNVVLVFLNDYVWPLFKTVFEGVSEVVRGFWDFVSPIINWFIDLLGSVVSFALDYFLAPLDIAFQTVVQIIKDIVDPIGQVFDGIKQMFQGIIDFVMGIFTGDWERAWEGVKEIFSGMWDSLTGIVDAVWKTITGLFSKGGEIFSGVVGSIADAFRSIVNCIIDGMNKVIAFPFNKINGLLNEIRSFDVPIVGPVFEGLWGENPLPVPQIPKLAQGGYVGANQPQLAMIGDNKRYGEIVAPEDKLNKIMNDALDAHQGRGMDTSLIEELLMMIIKILEDLDLVADIDIDGFVRLIRNKEKRLGMQIVR